MNLHTAHRATLDWLHRHASIPYAELVQQVVRRLRRTCPHYTWVGIYMLEGDHLKLWAWDGPQATRHVEIPLNVGICGLAASTGQTVNVPDVRADDRYLACFPSTRSELVVPIQQHDRVYGEIDIDSDVPAAFSEEDEAFLEAIALRLAARAAREGLPGRPRP